MKKFFIISLFLLLSGCSLLDKTNQNSMLKTQTSDEMKESEVAQSNSMLPSKIAFSSNRDGNVEVYVMDADGQNQTRLTNTPFFDGAPAWSNNGLKLAFISDRDGNAEIYTMDANGNYQTNISNHPYDDTYPDWSPDMQKIVFESTRDGNLEIYVMNADGSGQTRLTNSLGDDYGAKYSLDGRNIAFTSMRDGNAEIYVMESDGSHLTNLTNSVSNEVFTSWSGDGTKMLFDTDRDGHYEIYSMNSDGSDTTRLTYSAGNWGFADWSPDGEKLIFAEDNGSDWDILVMNADGTNISEIVSGQSSDYDPCWSPGIAMLQETSAQTNDSVLYPTPTILFTLPTIEKTSSSTDSLVGWIEIINTGTVSLDQVTPTTLDQLVIFHGSDASGLGFQCQGCYAIEPAIDIQVNVPTSDINGSDIIFRTGEAYQYLIRGNLTDKTVGDFFAGNLPVFEVTYLERQK